MGTAAGRLLAFWASRLFSAVLFQVPPRDPVVFATGAVGLMLSGLLAGGLRAAARRGSNRAVRCARSELRGGSDSPVRM